MGHPMMPIDYSKWTSEIMDDEEEDMETEDQRVQTTLSMDGNLNQNQNLNHRLITQIEIMKKGHDMVMEEYRKLQEENEMLKDEHSKMASLLCAKSKELEALQRILRTGPSPIHHWLAGGEASNLEESLQGIDQVRTLLESLSGKMTTVISPLSGTLAGLRNVVPQYFEPLLKIPEFVKQLRTGDTKKGASCAVFKAKTSSLGRSAYGVDYVAVKALQLEWMIERNAHAFKTSQIAAKEKIWKMWERKQPNTPEELDIREQCKLDLEKTRRMSVQEIQMYHFGRFIHERDICEILMARHNDMANVVKVFAIGSEPLVIVMEWMDKSVRDYLASVADILWSEQYHSNALRIVEQTLQGMKQLYNAHLIQMDLNIGNVLLRMNGRMVEEVKISDFGLVKFAGGSMTNLEVTNPGHVKNASDDMMMCKGILTLMKSLVDVGHHPAGTSWYDALAPMHKVRWQRYATALNTLSDMSQKNDLKEFATLHQVLMQELFNPKI
jgi:serine/threonine protein kinase